VQFLWKTEAMLRMAVAAVDLALYGSERAGDALREGAQSDSRGGCAPRNEDWNGEFAADDLPADLEHGGSGIAGSVFAVLVNNGIIERVRVTVGGQMFYKERASRREGRKDAKVKVFRCADRAKAQAFLRTKQRVLELTQANLF
jgi:hypothetical protein